MQDAASRRYLVILGPTAVGKSRLAMRLARVASGEIVNADALQAYRGFDVGTAKPSPADREAVPHHLLDILEPSEPYSAGEFARRARTAMEEIWSRRGLPIVTGGSGLYLRALTEGISPMPEVPAPLRDGLRDFEGRRGPAFLRRALALNDPELATRLAAGDRQRTARGVEIAFASGRPLSWWQGLPPDPPPAGGPCRIGLTLPRSILYDRIASRVERMLERGWLDEVDRLLTTGFDDATPAFQAIGYRELARHLRGDGTLEEAMAEIVRVTRRFAKRQMTWFRKEPNVTWFRADRIDEGWSSVMNFLEICGSGRENG